MVTSYNFCQEEIWYIETLLQLCEVELVTKRVKFSIPDILDECDKLAGMNFYSGLDGTLGYSVVPIWKEDRELTSFVFNNVV